jgi:tetratricopeptide (TPR) repeat protein
MAHVLIQSGEFDEAVSYYHRAIYGQWKQDPGGNERNTRLELVNLLAQHGAKRELLAELLPLQDEAPNDVGTRMKIGHYYLLAGSAGRAAEMFHQILHQYPRNGDAYDGLGQAEFAQAKYPQAHEYFLAASRLKPEDEEIKNRLKLCERILDLDPTRRGLDPVERFQRSLKLVELSLASLSECAASASSQPAELMDRAKKALKARIPHSERATEANLDLAEELWQARRSQCPQAVSPAEQPIAAVLARMSQ